MLLATAILRNGVIFGDRTLDPIYPGIAAMSAVFLGAFFVLLGTVKRLMEV
jgi:hypothetical protein